MDQIIGKIRKNQSTEIWVLLTDYSGSLRADIRQYFKSSETGDWKPTRRGISFSLEEVPKIKNAIEYLISDPSLKQEITIRSDETIEVRAGIREYLGKVYVDFRTYSLHSKENKWKPTQKGFTINPEMLDILLENIELLEDCLDSTE